MSRPVVLAAVRTPVGRYGGALSHIRPDDLAALAISAAVERSGVNAGGDRGRLFRRREPGRRGQPQRRAHGRAARRTARVGRRGDSEPPLRVGAVGGRLCVSRGARRRRGALRRRRRGVDEPRPARHAQAREGLPAWRPDGVRHDARLALPQPADGGDVPAGIDGRDRRERRRAVARFQGGAGRVRAALAAALGGRRFLGRAHPDGRRRPR